MKKTHLHHLVWAAVALTAFLLGSQMTQPTESSPPTSSDNSPTRVSDRSSSLSVDSQNSRSSRTSGREYEPPTNTPLSDADLIELGREFRTAKGPIARRLAFSEILKNLTPQNARLLREQIAHLPQDSPEFREFHYAWGSIAGQEAVLHGADTPKRDMAATLAGWAATDPAAAMAYFDTLSPAQQSGSSHMKWGAAFGLADADPQLAVEFAIERFENGDKEAGKMARIATGAALRSGDPEEISHFLANIPDGEMNLQAHQHAASELAKSDPNGTIDWALSLPESDGKNHAVGSSFYAFASRNPEQAANAITQIPSTHQDAARYGYALRVVHDDPATGVEWATSISNPDARGRALVDTGRTFFHRDPEAAREWMSSANLPAESVQKITGGK
ncbi:MAG: hypothetical protein ACSHYF_02870 [Verrucomicrobiaceae bacterium]